jgi:squalene synthase HpnC
LSATGPARATTLVPIPTTEVATLVESEQTTDDRDVHPGRPPTGENFPVALRVLPAPIRRQLHALYRYARHLDDLGDEPRPGLTRAGRLALLDEWEAELGGLYTGRPARHPVLRTLAPVVRERKLPCDPLLRLIESNRIDQRVTRYDTFGQLVAYCTCSANPVGELVLRVFGQPAAYQLALSDRICTALQLIEHLQDVGEDYRRGRIYLPGSDRQRYGVAEPDLAASSAPPRLRQLIAFQAERAGDWLEAGAPLVSSLRGWARLAVSGYLAGGRAALAGLAARGFDPLPAPPKPHRRELLGSWLAATVRSAG